jgi:hypothetical protein
MTMPVLRDPSKRAGARPDGNLSDFLENDQRLISTSPGNRKTPPATHLTGANRASLSQDERGGYGLADDDGGGDEDGDGGGGKRGKKKRKKFRPKDHQEDIDFGTARTVANPLLIDMAGDLFWFKKSTNTTDVLKIRVDNEQNPFLEFLPGQGISGRRFRKLWLAWAQVVGASGSLMVSDGGGADMRVIG